MIIPKLLIERETPGESDLYGQPTAGVKTLERVAPVKLIFETQHTTVRTDSAGSHGHANEETANVILLFSPLSSVDLDDILTVLGHKVRVMRTHIRYRVTGQKDHIEVHCVAWK